MITFLERIKQIAGAKETIVQSQLVLKSLNLSISLVSMSLNGFEQMEKIKKKASGYKKHCPMHL